MKKWKSVKEVHDHALYTVGKKIGSVVKEESVEYYKNNPRNKGWIGNSIESALFEIPNNSRQEADIPYLKLEIKVTPIYKTKNGWSARERLTLNIFDFFDEYKREFKNASFLEKAQLMELIFYEYKKDVPSPELEIKAASLFDFDKLPLEDMLIIEQDWNIIVKKIQEGKAEELSDSLTKYLGATTKGGKSEKNMTNQPFSEVRAHRRAFTLKSTYMTQYVRRIMDDEKAEEKVIKNTEALKNRTFEDIVLENFIPYINQSKKSLGELFNINIPLKNDKASSVQMANKMLNVRGDIQDTEEFKKAGISVKIVTVVKNKERTTEHFKLTIPNNTIVDPKELVKENWDESILYSYLSETQFLLVVFEKDDDDVIFKGAKFWRLPYEDLEGCVKETWLETKKVFSQGVELTYNETKSSYRINNNLPNASQTKCLHMRPSAKNSSYYNDGKNAIKLPTKSKWFNRPNNMAQTILTDDYMTKQAWWFNHKYMYKQVRDLF